MAKKAKKKTAKKASTAARSRTKAKTAARATRSAARKPAAKKARPRKIDPLNREQYRSVTPLLIVNDMRRAIDFYSSAFGFKAKGVMDSPQGILHAELTLRDSVLMLSPESRPQNALSASTIGNTPATLYVLVEDVDRTFDRAIAAGAKTLMPVMDMFWGDRCGVLTDPEGNKWMVATHKSEPSPAEMAEAMRKMQEQMGQRESVG